MVKHQKVSKYCGQDCSFLKMSRFVALHFTRENLISNVSLALFQCIPKIFVSLDLLPSCCFAHDNSKLFLSESHSSNLGLFECHLCNKNPRSLNIVFALFLTRTTSASLFHPDIISSTHILFFISSISFG